MDGAGRRSIYVAVRRNFLSPFMLTFDTPVPFSSMGRRNISNVPAQPLILLNDPLVAELSGQWAERAFKETSESESESAAGRIEWLYQAAFARKPTRQEQGAALGYLKTRASEKNVSIEDAQLWKDLAHVLVNTKEFIYLR